MNTYKHFLKTLFISLTTSSLTITTVSHAAPLDISDEPLFLYEGVQPNILTVIDDSGSMDWLAVISEGGAAHTDDGTQPDRINDVGGSYTDIDYTPDSDLEARRLCPGYNTLAYNPSTTYTPWAGKDNSGTTYSDISDLTLAKDNPYTGSTDNISGNMYFLWDTTTTPTDYEIGECPDLPADEIVQQLQTIQYTQRISRRSNYCLNEAFTATRNSNAQTINYNAGTNEWCVYNSSNSARNFSITLAAQQLVNVNLGFTDNACRADSGCIVVDDLTTAEKTNYGNWYSYYRKREYVAKKATLALIDSSEVRMGVGTMHNNNSAGLGITDMTITANKEALMAEVAQVDSSNGTPTRRTLQRAGEYFKNGDGDILGLSSNPGTPILSEANGGSCQKNYTVLMSDGYASRSSSDPITSVGNVDSDDTNNPYDGGTYADSLSDTLADVAMDYYKNDISALPDKVNGEVANMHQHMVTYTVAFGLTGNLTCNPTTDSNCSFSWPSSISSQSADTIDDLTHAAYNGRGLYLQAADPQALIDSLETVLADIDAQTSSSAALAANSSTLLTDTVVYQALFNTGTWYGDLKSIPVATGTAVTNTDPCYNYTAGQVCENNPDWSAADEVDNLNYSSRVILTTKPSTGTAIAFRWPANISSLGSTDLDASQVTALTGNATASDEQNYGQALLNYLRGDQTNEGAGYSFRLRPNTVLGDIISSSPAYVGTPRFNYTFDNYSTFKANNTTRTAMVYVGANDGMLHGFDASTGIEKVAYVPSMVFDNLEKLSETSYSHLYYVDGSPTVGDAYFGGSWHSVLVGGLRAGGKGVYALDVTSPDTASFFSEGAPSTSVLWEYTDTDLGYTFSRPDIVKLNNGTWAAIFGNGYNSTTGVAHLFIVNLQTGALIKKISTGSGDSITPNGLATVTPVDIDGDFDTDYVYAGDLEGQLWKFDLTGSTVGGCDSGWNVAFYDTNNTAGNCTDDTATPLFTTQSVEGNPQPITSRPSISFHPDAAKPGVLVYFGTGRYIDISDSITTGQDTETFYSIWDDLTNLPPTFSRDGSGNDSDYIRQTINVETSVAHVDSNGTATGGVSYVRITSDNPIDWNSDHGWFMDLALDLNDNKSERQVTNSIVRGDRIIFNTLIPSAALCEFGGDSWLMELDYESGGRLGSSPLDVNNDGQINSDDIASDAGTDYFVGGMKQDGITTEPTIIESASGDEEYKLSNSSSGTTSTILESPPGGSTGSRKSWTELSL